MQAAEPPAHASESLGSRPAPGANPTLAPVPAAQAPAPIPDEGMIVPTPTPTPPPATPATPPPLPVNGATTHASNGVGGCTAPQLRRFIKSRPYVPMHELRRRFGINGNDDDVTLIALEPGPVFVGLPRREGDLLGELLRAGEVGYELSMDPRTPIVVGVYPMRPIPRS